MILQTSAGFYRGRDGTICVQDKPPSKKRTDGKDYKTRRCYFTPYNILMKSPATYYNSSNEGDGQWEHLLHLFFADFGNWLRQVVTHIFNTVHDLSLKWYTVLSVQP